MKELPFTFKSGGQRVAGTLTLPRGAGKSPGVVMCHGFTGNRIEAHFIFVKTSRALARAGIASLRFDFRGSGESAGEFREMTVPREIADARAAIRAIARQSRIDTKRIGIMGLSLGGCVAANAASREPLVGSLALWCATADPKSMMKRVASWGGRLRRDGRLLDVGGLGLGPAFFRDPDSFNPVRALVRCGRPFPVLVLKGTGDTVISMGENALYLEGLRKSWHPVKQILVPGAGHTFERLDHEREAIRITVDWFRKTI